MTAAETARNLVDLWSPYCERLEIAGSIRRGKPDPHDIELVAIPKVREEERQVDMFTKATVEIDLLSNALEDEKARGRVADRLDKNGRPAWGQKFKRLQYLRPGHGGWAVDLFAVTWPAQWGVIFAIRTGPWDFSRKVVTSQLQGGVMPVGMRVADGVLWRSNEMLDTPEEEDFFRHIGIPCWPPEERTLERLEALYPRLRRR